MGACVMTMFDHFLDINSSAIDVNTSVNGEFSQTNQCLTQENNVCCKEYSSMYDCKDCRKAYEKWACSMIFYDCHKKCVDIDVCNDVAKKCPYTLNFECPEVIPLKNLWILVLVTENRIIFLTIKQVTELAGTDYCSVRMPLLTTLFTI